MKKGLIAFIISLLTISSIHAQDQTGVFSISGNLSYGTEAESLGIGLRTQYGFSQHIRGAAEYKYYIERHGVSAWGISSDVHFVFGVTRGFALYPIAGLSFSRWTTDPGRIDLPGMEAIQFNKFSDNRLGVNMGFGGQIATGTNTFLQLEMKEALIKNYSQFVFSVGFMYQF